LPQVYPDTLNLINVTAVLCALRAKSTVPKAVVAS
jgi:hypothetical protein